ncbi:hypothetical protein HAX54_042478, partial [Datura stramonium]|nr:hypothetical protein [Datura stramonium]
FYSPPLYKCTKVGYKNAPHFLSWTLFPFFYGHYLQVIDVSPVLICGPPICCIWWPMSSRAFRRWHRQFTSIEPRSVGRRSSSAQ